MFPQTETRFRTIIRRSIDAAIDFATLGEYGLASAWELPETSLATEPDAASAEPRPSTRPRVTLVEPASAAGRARRDAERRAAPACAGQPVRGRSLDPKLPRTARQRDGMAPREQPCLLDG